MSKSLGNLVFVGDLCKEWDAAAVRLALLAHHYRQDWDWRTEVDMPAAAARLALWRSAPEGDGSIGLAAVRVALDEDLDTPAALRALDEEATAGRSVSAGARLLGVDALTHRGPVGRGRQGGPVPLGDHERCPDQER